MPIIYSQKLSNSYSSHRISSFSWATLYDHLWHRRVHTNIQVIPALIFDYHSETMPNDTNANISEQLQSQDASNYDAGTDAADTDAAIRDDLTTTTQDNGVSLLHNKAMFILKLKIDSGSNRWPDWWCFHSTGRRNVILEKRHKPLFTIARKCTWAGGVCYIWNNFKQDNEISISRASICSPTKEIFCYQLTFSCMLPW